MYLVNTGLGMMSKNDLNLFIADEHPAKDLIMKMLVRRGDKPGVAEGRALAIVEALLDTKMLKKDKGKFLSYDHNRGIINI